MFRSIRWGLAGLLVATVPGALPGAGPTARLSAVGNAVSVPEGASAAPAASAAAAAAGAAAPSSESIQMSAPPVPADDGNLFAGSDNGELKSQAVNRDESDVAGDASVDELALRDDPSDTSGLSTLIVLGGLMTIVGLGLFTLRWRARRLG